MLAWAALSVAHAQPATSSESPKQAAQQAALRARLAALQHELLVVETQNVRQAAALRVLIQRLQQLNAQINPHPKLKAKPAPRAAASDTANAADDTGHRQAPAQTETSKAVYAQQNALFTRRLTLEPKLTYTYYDRNEVSLNGFLALNAIFLGNISIQTVKASTLQFDLQAREGVTQRLQVALDLPFLYRSFEFISGGAGSSASTLSQGTSTSKPFEQGDVNAGIYYQVAKETAAHPNVVWNAQVIAPTGIAPYGIKLVQPDPNNSSLMIPASLPTGNGLWGVQTGMSFVKTSDPGILFASIGYLHYFPHYFRDISNTLGTVTPGFVELGDVYQYGLGMAFALNRRMSISTSFTQSVSGRAETRASGGTWQNITGTDANAASFNIGVTYGLSDRETLVTNLGIGMTKDAPDISLSIGVPYSF